MQKKLIAVAVAGALAAPAAMAEVRVGGSVRVGVAYDGSEMSVENVGSRVHFRSDSDLGNGQSVFVNYEMGINAAHGTFAGGSANRLSLVGMKGDWGQVSLGSQWSAMYNATGTYMWAQNWIGGGAYAKSGGQNRMTDSIYMSTSLGGLNLMGDLQMNTETGDDLDKATIAANMSIGSLNLAAAWQDNPDGDVTTVAGALDIGGLGLSGGYISQSEGVSGFNINANLFGVSLVYNDNDTGFSEFGGVYAMSLGGGASLNIEVADPSSGNTYGIGYLPYNF